MPPRVAHTLMTIGRFAERAESTARLVKVADDLSEDFNSRPGTPGAEAAAALLDAVTRITGIERWYAESPLGYLTRVALDPAARGGVHNSARRLTAEAQEVRDLMSVDVWSVFNRLERTLVMPPDGPPAAADAGRRAGIAAGLCRDHGPEHGPGLVLGVPRRRRTPGTGPAHRLAAAARHGRPGRIRRPRSWWPTPCCGPGESIITHRRRAASGTGPATAAESVRQLLVHDPANPRSVAYQLAALSADLRLVGDERLADQAAGPAGRGGRARRRGTRRRRRRGSRQLARALDALGDRIAARHFARQATRRTAETDWSAAREED